MHPSISNAWTHNKRTVTYMTFIGIKTNSCARYIEHKESILIPPAGVTYRLCKRTCACTLESDFKCDKNCNLFLFFSMHFPFLFVESFEQNWLSNKWCDVISPSFSLILLASVCSPSLKNNPFLNGQLCTNSENISSHDYSEAFIYEKYEHIYKYISSPLRCMLMLIWWNNRKTEQT